MGKIYGSANTTYPVSGVLGGFHQGIFLPEEKVTRLKVEVDWLLSLGRVSCQHIMMVLGHLTAAIPAVMWAQSHLSVAGASSDNYLRL